MSQQLGSLQMIRELQTTNFFEGWHGRFSVIVKELLPILIIFSKFHCRQQLYSALDEILSGLVRMLKDLFSEQICDSASN